jgi:hypothetical protein
MLLAIAAALTLALLAFTFLLRKQNLPVAAAPAPWQHLEGRKAAIYENLRDLQFEYRVGKLSDADYEQTKKSLQAELATLLEEIDKLKSPGASAAPPVQSAAAVPAHACPHCGAQFKEKLKFCGECGKPMGGQA